MASDNNRTTETQLAVIMTDVGYMKSDISDIKRNLSQGYVTKEEFEPIKRFVYGLIAAFTVALVGAVVTLLVTLR